MSAFRIVSQLSLLKPVLAWVRNLAVHIVIRRQMRRYIEERISFGSATNAESREELNPCRCSMGCFDGRDAGEALIREGLPQRWPNVGNIWCKASHIVQ